ncbi:MAG: alpha/beta hydrolase [Actinomycetia bacterium]|nr:alpha/beta hydrolase [Actinomycetes bacterium]
MLPPDLLALDDIVETRTQLAELRKAEPLPEGVTTEDMMVTGPEGDTEVMVRVYRPAELAPNAPALYWIHGGGLVLGNVQMNDNSCATIADNLGVLVASVEYRLAPEHPYPAPLEDCYAGLKWLHGSVDELGVDIDRIAIGGASAGGNLAAGLALLARDRAEIPVCFQLLVYPMLDDRNTTPSSHAITDPKVWNRHANLVGWNSYLEGRAGADDVPTYAAPARATDLAGLPPAYIPVGDLDLFLDEDVDYATRLMAAGVPVELHVYPGAFHGSNGFVPWAELSRRWVADEHAALARAFGLV